MHLVCVKSMINKLRLTAKRNSIRPNFSNLARNRGKTAKIWISRPKKFHTAKNTAKLSWLETYVLFHGQTEFYTAKFLEFGRKIGQMAINPAWPGFWELHAIQTGSKQSVFLPKVSRTEVFSIDLVREILELAVHWFLGLCLGLAIGLVFVYECNPSKIFQMASNSF